MLFPFVIGVNAVEYSIYTTVDVCYNVGGYAIVFYLTYEDEIAYAAVAWNFVTYLLNN